MWRGAERSGGKLLKYQNHIPRDVFSITVFVADRRVRPKSEKEDGNKPNLQYFSEYVRWAGPDQSYSSSRHGIPGDPTSFPIAEQRHELNMELDFRLSKMLLSQFMAQSGHQEVSGKLTAVRRFWMNPSISLPGMNPKHGINVGKV